jgi:ribosome-binding protein aMBF1 (putative translation factor)
MNHNTTKNVVREAREKRGMSQREWAKQIGTTQATVCRLEKGLQMPTARVQLAYERYGVRLRDFPAAKRRAA